MWFLAFVVAFLFATLQNGLVSCFVVSPQRFTTTTRTTSSYLAATTTTTEEVTSVATLGSIVQIECDIKPEGNDFVPESFIDLDGTLTFLLGGGNYLPGLHELVNGMKVGDKLSDDDDDTKYLDAGWGERNPELVIELTKDSSGLPKDALDALKVGMQLQLVNGMKATITKMTDETFTIDANPPLAGTSYKVHKLELLSVQDAPTQMIYGEKESTATTIQACTFALGCFWGGELEFMRKRGVVGTKVGYTQGEKLDPTYQEVCSGMTGHTEAIMVYYDLTEVTYKELVTLAMDRLGENKFLLNQVGNDVGTQYRHGIYYHNDEQKTIATDVLSKFGSECKTECLPSLKFYDAEDYHQQYLLKGGQSARKDHSMLWIKKQQP